jgi:hypothetical protein
MNRLNNRPNAMRVRVDTESPPMSSSSDGSSAASRSSASSGSAATSVLSNAEVAVVGGDVFGLFVRWT